MFAAVHLLIVLQLGLLCYLTYRQFEEFTSKTGRVVYVLMRDGDAIAVFRSLQSLKNAAEDRMGHDTVKWERSALHVHRHGRWIYSGYHHEALPVQGSVTSGRKRHVNN